MSARSTAERDYRNLGGIHPIYLNEHSVIFPQKEWLVVLMHFLPSLRTKIPNKAVTLGQCDHDYQHSYTGSYAKIIIFIVSFSSL